jgi:Glycosyl transferase family 2
VTVPLISVVIPTRDRPDTLAVCLRAMRHHKSSQIEIVVQDNSTSPETRDVVTAAAVTDPRIRYLQAPYPTSQRHNFELGLAAARGAYMSIIGDDDGYTIGSLDWLVEQLTRTPVDAVRWHLLHYVWPSLSQDGEGFMDLYPSMTLGGSSFEPAVDLAERVIRAQTQGSWDNILVYHGMISRRVYDRMKAKTDGVFFPYPMPDVYAHNLIPLYCDTYLKINDIVSIYGVSGHSAGASWTRTRDTDPAAPSEGNRWMAESVADPVAQNLAWQPDIRTLRYHDFAAFKVAESFGMLNGKILDKQAWIDAIIAELKMSPHQLAPWLTVTPKASFDAEIIEKVREAFKGDTTPKQAPNTNKKSHDPRIPSLRVRAVDKMLPDDVEGAMLAASKLIGSEPSRFDAVPELKKQLVAAALKTAMVRFRRVAPGVSSRLINSKYVPPSVWRYLKMISWDTNQKNRSTYVTIKELQDSYDANQDRSKH